MRRNLPRILAALVLVPVLFLAPGCSSSDGTGSSGVARLSAALPALALMHGAYYSLDYGARSIEIVFNEPVTPWTLWGAILLFDKNGSLAGEYEIRQEGTKVVIQFHPGFELTPGWQYFLSIDSRLRSISGLYPEGDQVFELRTTTRPALEAPAAGGNGIPQRTKVVCISDLHMGEDRAVAAGYCWFDENADALLNFIQAVQADPAVRQLVILGDLFDEWLIPYASPPFNPPVADDRDYFVSVRNAAKNKPILDLIQDMAATGQIQVVYVQGNHDMRLTQAVLNEVLPGVVFMGQNPVGLGFYSPVSGVAMEHGHRYDFFNCPQPLVNPPHYLPPGYFVSRLWASGMETEAALGWPTESQAGESPYGDAEIQFPAAWDLATLYTLHTFPELPAPDLDQDIIVMSGIDDYANPFSFNGALDMYVNGNIETLWPDTQNTNQVTTPYSVFAALLNGHSNLFGAAQDEYLKTGGNTRIVVFGHTHEPMIEPYPVWGTSTGIYANTGSWVNENNGSYKGGTSNKVRTFVVLSPGEWTGSDLDVVTLNQYNPKTGGGYEIKQLGQESLETAP